MKVLFAVLLLLTTLPGCYMSNEEVVKQIRICKQADLFPKVYMKKRTGEVRRVTCLKKKPAEKKKAI